jgi:hypothetical protein
VGIHVDERHRAATKIGQRVTLTADLLEVKVSKLRYAVSATNDQGAKIGEGLHRRALINTGRFTECAPVSALHLGDRGEENRQLVLKCNPGIHGEQRKQREKHENQRQKWT